MVAPCRAVACPSVRGASGAAAGRLALKHLPPTPTALWDSHPPFPAATTPILRESVLTPCRSGRGGVHPAGGWGAYSQSGRHPPNPALPRTATQNGTCPDAEADGVAGRPGFLGVGLHCPPGVSLLAPARGVTPSRRREVGEQRETQRSAPFPSPGPRRPPRPPHFRPQDVLCPHVPTFPARTGPPGKAAASVSLVTRPLDAPDHRRSPVGVGGNSLKTV